MYRQRLLCAIGSVFQEEQVISEKGPGIQRKSKGGGKDDERKGPRTTIRKTKALGRTRTIKENFTG